MRLPPEASALSGSGQIAQSKIAERMVPGAKHVTKFSEGWSVRI
ncbi:hypothetical protein A4U88_4756 [Serratia marcescens]|nr:hypothetical protein A4U88_4756 [Serratia marcescens]